MCISPVSIRQNDAGGVRTIAVPCGKCYECRQRRSSQWAFRLLQERKQHSVAHFVTLTYEDDKLHWVGLEPTLFKKDLQNFFKRLRKNTKKTIKYYACGEYGGESKRPHYHAIIYGVSDSDIENNWSDGHVHFGDVDMPSIRYVTQYMCKSSTIDYGARQPEFAVMSKKLGIGYLTNAMKSWHYVGLKPYCVMPDGHKIGIPRYYKEKIFDEQQRKAIAAEHVKQYTVRYEAAVEKHGGEYNLELKKSTNIKAAIARAAYKQKLREKQL